MQKQLDEVQVLNHSSIKTILEEAPRKPFERDTMVFLDVLSKTILRLPDIREYPDLLTFAFFCRISNQEKIKEHYAFSDKHKIGRGLAYHVAPSNVPLNFAYSFVVSLLSGNTNIVRIPTKEFIQTELFLVALRKIESLSEHQKVTRRTSFVRYPRESYATEYFSSICDVRIIWGGDTTVNMIRQKSIPPRSIDVTFPDRYSICAIDAEAYLACPDKDSLAKKFYNDTYLFDQNACSSPQFVFWKGMGETLDKAKVVFWQHLEELVNASYDFSPIFGVDKITNFMSKSISGEQSKLTASNNLLWRVELENLPEDILSCTGSAGYFYEYTIKDLDNIVPLVTGKFQTLAYYGISHNELLEFINKENLRGIDRIVPIGETSSFDFTWDGYNLVEYLSREIVIL